MRGIRIFALLVGVAWLFALAGGGVAGARAQGAAVPYNAGPPVARIVPEQKIEHGRTRDDPYD